MRNTKQSWYNPCPFTFLNLFLCRVGIVTAYKRQSMVGKDVLSNNLNF